MIFEVLGRVLATILILLVSVFLSFILSLINVNIDAHWIAITYVLLMIANREVGF